MSIMNSCCSHITVDMVVAAAQRVQQHKAQQNITKKGKLLKRKVSTCHELQCVQCGESGDLGEWPLHKHFLDHGHCFGVRVVAPYELYCDTCGDYQYSTHFDNLVERKRTAPSAPLPSPQNAGTGTGTSSSRAKRQTQTFPQANASALTTAAQRTGTVGNGKAGNKAAAAAATATGAAGVVAIDRYFLPWRPVRGYCNMGATCFMSSILQVLLNNHRIRKTLQNVLPFNANGVIDSPGSVCTKNSTNSSANGYGRTASDGLLLPMPENTDGCIACETRNLLVASIAGPPVPYSLEPAIASNLSRSRLDINPNPTSSPDKTSPGKKSKSKNKTNESTSTIDDSGDGGYGYVPAYSVEQMRQYHVQSRTLAASTNSTNTGSSKRSGDNFPALVPSNLLFSVWNYANYMAGYEQQDAHEFLIAFLDGLETHLRQNHSHRHSYHDLGALALASGNSGNGSGGSSSDGGGVSEAKADVSDNSSFVTDSGNCSMVGIKAQAKAANPSPSFSFMKYIFNGTLRSEVQCADCGNKSKTCDPFLDISLSLLDTAKKGTSGGGSNKDGLAITDCLNDFTKKEQLSAPIFCTKCEKNQASSKTFTVAKAPEVLVIHLKRFDSVSQRKVHTKVHFDVGGLDMGPYMSVDATVKDNADETSLSSTDSFKTKGKTGSPSSAKKGKNQGQFKEKAKETKKEAAVLPPTDLALEQKSSPVPSVMYDLHGVVTHKGSLNSGHYISFILSGTEPDANGHQWNQWLRCDDETVTPVEYNAVQDTEAYILFYEKRLV